jgi:hypothetical protein
MCQAFVEAGHDVTHLEERGNPHLREMLEVHGYAPIRAFNKQYPLIRYRQYDLTGGWERVVWFGREIGTADAVVAYPGVAEVIVQEIAAVGSSRIVTFWPGVTGPKRDLLPLWYGPAEAHVVARDTIVGNQFDHDAAARAQRLAIEIDRLLKQPRPG